MYMNINLICAQCISIKILLHLNDFQIKFITINLLFNEVNLPGE